MHKFLWFIVLVAALVLFGCDTSEQPEAQTAPAKKQPVKAEEVKKAEDVKIVVPAIEAAQAAADKAQEKVEQTARIAETPVEKAATDSSSAAVEMVKEAEETAVKTAEGIVTKVEEPVVTAVAAMESTAAQPVETVKTAATSQEIILQASYGNITFPHGMHADTYECSICHSEGTPAAFDITKDVAHKLCKGCHKEEGAGPTGCRDCHKK